MVDPWLQNVPLCQLHQLLTAVNTPMMHDTSVRRAVCTELKTATHKDSYCFYEAGWHSVGALEQLLPLRAVRNVWPNYVSP